MIGSGVITSYSSSLPKNTKTSHAQQTPLIIDGGAPGGLYLASAAALCQSMQGQNTQAPPCFIRVSRGSWENIQEIAQKQATLALVQSDVQFAALYQGKNNIGPQPQLRSVLSLHAEPLTLLVRKDSKINNITDIKGKKIGFSTGHAGQEHMVLSLLQGVGINREEMAQFYDLKPTEISSALCGEKIDIGIYTVAHPSGLIMEAINQCNLRFLSIDQNSLNIIHSHYPYYTPTNIPLQSYGFENQESKTFGIRATLVADATTEAAVIERFVSLVLDNIQILRSAHPVFADLKITDMMGVGATASIHLGAKAAFDAWQAKQAINKSEN
ncbi:MAG: TAXI family TRAP transporter solute-binding subunit [Alphaproteobacteria bacterium]